MAPAPTTSITSHDIRPAAPAFPADVPAGLARRFAESHDWFHYGSFFNGAPLFTADGPPGWPPGLFRGTTGTTGDRRAGKDLPRFWSEMDLRGYRVMSRWLWDTNPFMLGFGGRLVDYHVGKGYQWQACLRGQRKQPYATAAAGGESADAKLVMRAQDILDGWRDRVGWPLRAREGFRRLRRDGEVIQRFFRGPYGDLPEVRWVNPEQVGSPTGDADGQDSFGVRTAEGDGECPVAVFVRDHGGPDTAGEWVNCDRRDPTARVLFHKTNTDADVKRGLPDSTPVNEGLDECRKLVRNMVVVATAQAAIAWLEKFPTATPEQVRSMIPTGYPLPPAVAPAWGAATGETVYSERLAAGTVLRTEGSREFQPGPASTNVGSYVEAEQACLRMVCVRWGLPPYMTAKSDDINFASSLTAGSPFAVAVEGGQAEWAVVERDTAAKVLDLAREAGLLTWAERQRLDVEVIPPTVAGPDKKADTDRLLGLLREKVLDPYTVQQELGYDPSHVEANWDAWDRRRAKGVGADDALRGNLSAVAAIQQLQTAVAGGQLAAEAAVQNLGLVFGLEPAAAARLFPAKAPTDLTPDGAGPDDMPEPGPVGGAVESAGPAGRRVEEAAPAPSAAAHLFAAMLQARADDDDDAVSDLADLAADPDALAALVARLGGRAVEGWTAFTTRTGTVGAKNESGAKAYGARARALLAAQARADKGEAQPETPQAKAKRLAAEREPARAEAREAFARAMADPAAVTPEHVEALRDHLHALTRDEARAKLKELGERTGGRLKADIVDGLLAHVRGKAADRDAPAPADQTPAGEPVAAGQPAATKPARETPAADRPHPTVAALRAAVDTADGLSDEQRTQYKEASARVVGRMPAAARDRLHAKLPGGAQFYPDGKAVGFGMLDGLINNPDVSEAEREIARGLRAAVEKGLLVPVGAFDPASGAVHLNGGGEAGSEVAGGYAPAGGLLPTHHVHAHEFAHALDGQTVGADGSTVHAEHSDSAGWRAAYAAEIDRDGNPLTHYARVSPSEGFAEFGRLLYSGDHDLGEIERDFPRAAAYWRQAGLWPDGGGGDAPVAAFPEAFDRGKRADLGGGANADEAVSRPAPADQTPASPADVAGESGGAAAGSALDPKPKPAKPKPPGGGAKAKPPGWVASDPTHAAVADAYAGATGKAREVIENALANAGWLDTDAAGNPTGWATEAPADRDLPVASDLAAGLASGHRQMIEYGLGTPADIEAVEAALAAAGATRIDAAPAGFDGAVHEEPFPGAFTGHPVRVTHPGWSVPSGPGRTFTPVKAKVEPAGAPRPATPPAATSGNSPTNPSTAVDNRQGTGNTTPVPATPAGGQGGGTMTTDYRHDFVPGPAKTTRRGGAGMADQKLFAAAVFNIGSGRWRVSPDETERAKMLMTPIHHGIRAGYLPSEVAGRLIAAGAPAADVNRIVRETVENVRGDEDDAPDAFDWPAIDADVRKMGA